MEQDLGQGNQVQDGDDYHGADYDNDRTHNHPPADDHYGSHHHHYSRDDHNLTVYHHHGANLNDDDFAVYHYDAPAGDDNHPCRIDHYQPPVNLYRPGRVG